MMVSGVTSAVDPHPSTPVWTLPAHWQAVDLISDLHLADDTPTTWAALDAHLAATPADAVLLLGDVFEVWVGDDGLDDTTSFEARVIDRLAQHARRLTLAFMAGNRDFLLGPRACATAGLHALADPTVVSAWGQRVLLAHGDAWCLDDAPYQAFRTQVRSAEWQQQFLARPLADRRALARQMRGASEQRKRTLGAEAYADLDAAAVDAALAAADASVLVHGHTHRPATHVHTAGRVRHVLSDWHCEPDAPRRAEVLRWTAAGFERLPPAG